jgi:hypothetical protein
MIPAYQGIYDGVEFPPSQGWVNEGLLNIIAYESTLDLSGYEMDRITFYTQGAEVQDPGRYVLLGAATCDVEVLDIVSQERLSLLDIDNQLLAGSVLGDYRLMVVQNTSANLELLSTIGGGTFGSGEPTAASRLWVYRIVRINGTKPPGAELRIPASRFMLQGIAATEEDLPYMMRLKRSFELSTQG